MAAHPRAATLGAHPRLPGAAGEAERPGGRAASRRALEGAAVLVQSRWRRVPGLLLLGLLLVAVGALGIYQVLQSSRIAETGYELLALERERARLAAEVRLLEGQVAELSRGDDLVERATAGLGMVETTTMLTVAVDVAAPATIRLPERYVPFFEEPPEPPASLWSRLLNRLPGGGM